MSFFLCLKFIFVFLSKPFLEKFFQVISFDGVVVAVLVESSTALSTITPKRVSLSLNLSNGKSFIVFSENSSCNLNIAEKILRKNLEVHYASHTKKVSKSNI